MSAHLPAARHPVPQNTLGKQSLAAHAVPSSGGQRLDKNMQNAMSTRFGHDFSQVRIHTDRDSERSAQALGAHAYTTGTDIVFGDGEYTPGSPQTERLLAHELTHVVQQARFGAGDAGRLSRRGDPSEQEAEAVSSRIATGRPVEVLSAPDAAFARDESDMGMSLIDEPQVCVDPNQGGLPPQINPFGPTELPPADPLGPTEFPDMSPNPVDPVFPPDPKLPNIPEPPPGGFPEAPPSPATGAGEGILDTIGNAAMGIGGTLFDFFPPVPTSLFPGHGPEA